MAFLSRSCFWLRAQGLTLLLALCLLTPALGARAEDTASSGGESLSEARVTAAFIVNFIQFVRWPQQITPLQLCVVGPEHVGDVLEALSNLNREKSALAIRRLRFSGETSVEIKGCHALFIPAVARSSLAQILKQTQGKPVLVISDITGAAALGVALGLVPVSGNRLSFDANFTAAREAGLILNARLLQLARRVY